MQKSIYILVCTSVRTNDDPQESFNVLKLLARTRKQFHEDAALGSSFDKIQCIDLFYYAYCVRVLVNLENHQTRIKLMFAY